ncbi:hypothetical protein KEM54_001854 [Ascosphaera aggregata]|nr:hypothetical protein KEM54_001854 [Ascosphaera aggregata]
MRIDKSLVAAFTAAFIAPADAFWRLPCRGRSGVARIDPIVDPGRPAAHVHSLHGSGGMPTLNIKTNDDLQLIFPSAALSFSSDREELRKADCTSCAVKEDKSAYWTPSLYFQHTNGSTEIVPQVGGLLAYYLLYGQNVKAFPKGFRMLAGDQQQRNFTLPFPDPPKSMWKGIETTEFALMQKAIGFNCLNYAKAPEPSLYRHTLPDKDYLDQHCTDGVRMEVAFPSCWNGKDLDSPNHRDHMRYPNLVSDGVCPKGFETRLVSLFYETIWNTAAFKEQDGRFVLANGDPTGCGYHADFMEGWDDGVLQRAVDICTNPSGRVEDCSVFTLQDEQTQQKCLIKVPDAIKHEDTLACDSGLPGGMPIIEGPAYATGHHGHDGASSSPATSSSTSTPTHSPSPFASPSPASTPVHGIFAPQPNASSSQADAQTPAQKYQLSATGAAPATTSAPDAGPLAGGAAGGEGHAVSTKVYTTDRQVVELVFVEEDVTKTTTVEGDATPAPAKRVHTDFHLKHAHVH